MSLARCLIAALLLAPAIPAANPPGEIPKGAHVLLRFVNAINTRTAREGDFVYLQTASPLAAGGRVLVPEHCYVQGVVAHAKRSGRVSGRAELAIRLETLTFPSGLVLRITPKVASVDSGNSDQRVEGDEGAIQQGSDVGRDAERVAILAGTGASIGGIADQSWSGAGIGAGIGAGVGVASALLRRGREVDLKPGMSIDVVFDRAVLLE
jgi:hypothetical protein